MTDIALKEYLERLIYELDRRNSQRFEDFDRRHDQRFEMSGVAITKAERTMNERLNGMNEFRDALKDQAAKMATRSELETLELLVQELRRDKSNMDGRLAVLAVVISIAVSVAISVLSYMLRR